MSERRTFVDLVLLGEIADPDDAVDEYIDRWHGDPTLETLSEWLGFTQAEWEHIVASPGHERERVMSVLRGRR